MNAADIGVDAGGDRARPAHDSRAGLLLRRPRALEERAEHDDDERRRRSASSAIAWAARRLLARVRARGPCVGGPLARSSARRRPRAAAARSRTSSSSRYQGTFAIITAALISGAIVERMRFRRLPRVHRALGARRLRAGRPLGLGRRLARRSWARSTSPAEPSSTSTRRRRRSSRRSSLGPRKDFARQAHAAAQRSLHAARRGASLVRLVRIQRGQRARGQRHRGARVHEHDARADRRRSCVWTLLDLKRIRQGDGGRRGHRDRRRPGRRHAGRRVRLAAVRDRCWARSRPSRATSRCSGGRARGSTTRSTSSRRTASAARSARS